MFFGIWLSLGQPDDRAKTGKKRDKQKKSGAYDCAEKVGAASTQRGRPESI
jgi:hypothetical protein